MTSSAKTPSAGQGGGPKTPKGRARSSRNAVKHGLRAASFTSGAAEAMALAADLWARAGDPPREAIEVAQAILHLDRIRLAKRQIVAVSVNAGLASGMSSSEAEGAAICACARQLLIFDGYERRAMSKLKGAQERLDWI